MRYKQITDPSELSQFDYQEIARYVNIRSKQLRDYKANVKAQRRLDGNATAVSYTHLTLPTKA